MNNSDSTCDYFALSDQDDIWLANKVALAMDRLSQCDNTKPLLYASLSRITDSDLNIIADLPIPERGVSYYNAMVQNVLPGHTQVMNRVMLELLLRNGFNDVHVLDWWFYLAATAVGEVVFQPEYTVLHRQHSNNAVGVKTCILENFKRRIGYIMAGRGNAFSKQLYAFLQRYGEQVPEEYRQETIRFFTCLPSFWSRLHYAFTCKAYRQSKTEDLIFRCLYTMGKYKL
jgi:hypothetical protein